MTEKRKQRMEEVLQKRQNGLTVVLENIFDPHNISAVMRSCDAVGVQEIYVLSTRTPRQASWGFRSSGSAYKWLTVHQFNEVEACVAAVRLKYKKLLATHLSPASVSIYETDLTQSVALIFGNEHSGVSEALLAGADGNLIIPQVGMIRSLNLSVACAVSLYEAFRQKQLAGHYDAPQLSMEERAEISQGWGL